VQGVTLGVSKHWIRLAALLGACSLAVVACGSSKKSSSANTTAAGGASQTTAAGGSSQTTAAGGSSQTTAKGGSSQTTAAADPTLGGTPVKGGSLTFALDQESSCYVPSLCTVSFAGASVQKAVLDWLVTPSTSPKGYDLSIADSITPNADFTSFTVKIKPGIKYSDGTPFTAGDIKKEFDQYILAPTSTLKGNVAAVASVDSPDDSTVVFNLKQPDAPFPVILSLIPLFKPGPTDKGALPVGTGPFKMTSWTPNQQITLDRNPNYWGTDNGTQLPYLDQLIFKPITSADTRLTTLQSGAVVGALIDDPITLSQANKISGIKSLTAKSDSGEGFFFDNSKPPTDDVRVRQALAYATDKNAVLASIGGGVLRDQYFAPSSPFYSQDVSKATPTYDLNKAKQLLSAYANDPKRSDGKAVGDPVAIDISYVNGQVAQQNQAQVAQQEWGQAGAKVTVTPKDAATLISDAIKGNFIVNYFEWATPDPYSLFTHNYLPWPADPSNFTHFNNDQVQADIAKMATASTQDELKPSVSDIGMVLAQNVPLVFLASTNVSWALQPTKVANANVLHGVQLLDWSKLSAAKS
jgi:peptide/nickel transport system substrate-binding protein